MHKEYNSKAKFIYVEDGLSAYYEYEEVPALKQNMHFVLSKIFGKHFEITPYHGAHSLITEGIVLEPESANKGLKQKVLSPMPPFALDDTKIELLIEAFSSTRYEWEHFRHVIMFCAPLSIAASPQFIADIQKLTKAALEQGKTVIYKYHPRETQTNYLGLALDKRPILIDRTIPAELICARLGEQLEQIYTQFGSILFTAKWVNPSIERYMIMSGATISIRYSETVYNLLIEDGVQVVR